MEAFNQALKNMAFQFDLMGARLGGYQVLETEVVRPGEVIINKLTRTIYVYKPTEIQRIVRLGIREDHPWFNDPLDPLKMVR